MRQPMILMCATADRPPAVPSEERWCVICAAGVWVSQPLLEEVDDGTVEPHCWPCGSGIAAAQGAVAVLHHKQVDDLRGRDALSFAERTIKELNRRWDH